MERLLSKLSSPHPDAYLSVPNSLQPIEEAVLPIASAIIPTNSSLHLVPLESSFRQRLERAYVMNLPITLLHDLPIALFESGRLPNVKIIHNTSIETADLDNLDIDWLVCKTPYGTLFAHSSFLKIQNAFNNIEGKEVEQWNASKTMEAFTSYLEVKGRYQDRHEAIFTRALQFLSQGKSEKIQNTWREIKTHLLKNPDIVALPFYSDNPNLWDDLYQLQTHQKAKIPDITKIASNNLVFASEKERYKHDYFSFAARKVIQGSAENITDQLLLTAQHEGSHWATDHTIIKFLDFDYADTDPLAEGIASYLGNDGKENLKGAPSLETFFANPMPSDESLAVRLAYETAPKFFRGVHMLIQKRSGLPVTETRDMETTAVIIASMLDIGLDIYENKETKRKSKDERMALFLSTLVNKLQINSSELLGIYNSIN